ncbi:MAG TPA: right-handed parallel beta-helix repeat-containing protein [Thermoanaerobaculia bacterium]|nr:right-handed parallel beta-helix repeat-containing protein [Thermoanaerobaculia bacterium]
MSPPAAPDIFTVPGDFPTLQAAIAAIGGPATILVAPGVHAGPFSISSVAYVVIQSTAMSRRGVTLTAEGGEAVLAIDGSTVHLSGIDIRSNQRTRGMVVRDSKVSLQECVIAGNRATTSGAAMLCARSSVHLQKSVFSGNTVESDGDARGGALDLDDCAAHIAGCTIQSNAVYARGEAKGGGIFIRRSRMRMWRSRVTENALYAPSPRGGGIYFDNPDGTQIGGSVISGNDAVGGRGGGIVVDGGEITLHRNTNVRLNFPDDLRPAAVSRPE